ncbi:type 1 glutamine amidotransferase [Exilibacterium tricleocarpae]|nr:type 1 glutamine amidotransferase [Exilibacterium tricleocarpae]
MNTKPLLIIDGNKRESNQQQAAMGGMATGEGYAAVLRRIDPAVQYTIVQPAYDDYQKPTFGPDDYRGAVITGSALHVYDAVPEVERQLALAAEVFDCGIPVFGSCWGLQVASTVLGGRVRANPRGRELGIARGICANQQGGEHPLLAGKGPVYDAVAIHTDEVVELPAGATLLASNTISEVQAVVIEQGDKRFWGVQYHPEFSLFDIGTIFLRYGEGLIADGFFTSLPALESLVRDFHSLDQKPDQLALSWRYGLSASVLDFDLRTRELRNWLQALG